MSVNITIYVHPCMHACEVKLPVSCSNAGWARAFTHASVFCAHDRVRIHDNSGVLFHSSAFSSSVFTTFKPMVCGRLRSEA
jgi:hypothetical protein